MLLLDISYDSRRERNKFAQLLIYVEFIYESFFWLEVNVS